LTSLIHTSRHTLPPWRLLSRARDQPSEGGSSGRSEVWWTPLQMCIYPQWTTYSPPPATQSVSASTVETSLCAWSLLVWWHTADTHTQADTHADTGRHTLTSLSLVNRVFCARRKAERRCTRVCFPLTSLIHTPSHRHSHSAVRHAPLRGRVRHLVLVLLQHLQNIAKQRVRHRLVLRWRIGRGEAGG